MLNFGVSSFSHWYCCFCKLTIDYLGIAILRNPTRLFGAVVFYIARDRQETR